LNVVVGGGEVGIVGIETKKEGYCSGWKEFEINRSGRHYCLIYFKFKANLEENGWLKKHGIEHGLTTKA
jgi:hypothetical protein